MDWSTISSGVFALLGVGAGGWLNRAAGSRRWQREWMTLRIQELRRVFAETMEAADAQYKVSVQAVQQLKRERIPVPQSRIADADQRWLAVFSRSSIEAPAEVQDAIGAFDNARDEVALAVNAQDIERANDAVRALEVARRALRDEMTPYLESINASLVPHLMTRRQRLVARIRKTPLPGSSNTLRGDSGPAEGRTD